MPLGHVRGDSVLENRQRDDRIQSSLYDWERKFVLRENVPASLCGSNNSVRDLISDFASRVEIVPKKNFTALLTRMLKDWKIACEGQTGYLAFTVQESDDQLLQHLTSLESLSYQRIESLNKSFNHFLSIYRAADATREFESLNGILDIALQFRQVHRDLQSIWSRLITLHIPRIQYNFAVIDG